MFKSIVTWPLLLAYIQKLKHKFNKGTIIQVCDIRHSFASSYRIIAINKQLHYIARLFLYQ